ncbi:MAG TPA: hypothetical protein VHM28_12235 [Anaerolineales bacterium]|jgi:hypothetical protein|nr:hypothetical protein [Anaerolineales bacterium]
MNSEEKKQILKMVEDGKISAEEAMKLIKALEESSVEMKVIDASEPQFDKANASEFEKIARQARYWWQILLWIGVGVTALSGYWLYRLVNVSNFGFWFYCAWAPLLFGVLLSLGLLLSASASRWLYVKVWQPEGSDWPHQIVFGLPLPLGWVGWFLRNFGQYIEGLRHSDVDEIIQFINDGFSLKEPLIVNIDQGEHGERVQVYLG